MRAYSLIHRQMVILSALLLLGLLAPASSFAQNLFYSVLLDTDDTPSTGCDVDLLGPDAMGIERRLTASVSRVTFQVTQTTLENCNTGTGLFDAPVALGGGYPVALSQGVGGSDAVEIAVAISQAGEGVAQIVFVAESTACEDVLEVAGPAIAVPIPILSWPAMALLAIVLLTTGYLVLRRWGFVYLSGLVLVSIAGVSIAAGFIANGDLSDWLGTIPLGQDATGDSSCGIGDVDIVAGFYAREGVNLYFRIDILDIEPPVAVDDNYVIPGVNFHFSGNNILSNGPNLVIATGPQGLLGNDTDPEGDPLSVVAFDAVGTNGGTVNVNADGTFTYNAPPPGPLTDTFTYTVADPGGLEDVGTVTMDLGGVVLTNGGLPITVTHVNSNSGGANMGTFEDPFTSLPTTQATNIVYVHGNSAYNLQSYSLNLNQRLLGEGNGNQHLVSTDQLGQINLLAGSGGAIRPVISNTPGVALDTNNGSELSNFNITGAGNAVRMNGLAGSVNVNRTLISGGSTGIYISGAGGTFTFTDVSITDPTGEGINVNGGSADVTFDATSSITQGNNASAINIHGGHTGMFDFNGPVNATNGNGLQFDNADGTYDFTPGPTSLNGGDAGIDILGGSSGTFTFTSTTTITNPTGIGLSVKNLDTGGVINYNGSIVNNNDVFLDIEDTAPGTEVNLNTTGANSLMSTNNPNGAIFIFNADGDITITTPVTITDPGFSAFFATDGDGVWSFTDMTIANQHGLNGGIDVFGQMGTVNFTNLAITTDSAGTGDATTGFLAGGNNIINVLGTATVNADGGGAIVLININTVNMAWMDVTSTNNTNTQIGFAGDDGIDLLNVLGGTFTVTGTTTIDNADGVGISIEGTGATVTFADVSLNDIGLDGIISGVALDNPGILNINGGSVSNTGNAGARIGSTFGSGTTGFNLNNTTFSGIGTFVARFANSTLSGAGNTAAPFSCDDGGGNTGKVFYNGGANSCPP